MRPTVKALVPGVVVRAYHRARRAQVDRRNASRTAREVFSEIYRERTWGGTGPFCSGSGSATDSIVGPYVATIRKILQACGPEKPRVLDLGCGDFTVGSQLVGDCSEYIGIDVVPELVAHLQATAAGERVKFLCLDIAEDELPAAEICLVRQVFQHLSNAQIANVLPKLRRYGMNLITEHLPHDGPSVIPNVDKVHGGGIRLYQHSGVYLDRPPFNVPSSDLEVVLEVPGHGLDGLHDPGVIRTFRLDFPSAG